jgi:hypothetical protein
VGVVDREIVRQPLAFGDPEHLRAGKADHPRHAGRLGGQQHMPGAQHVDRHDLLRAARGVVRERRQVDDRLAARGRAADGSKIQQILPLDAVETRHLVAALLEEARHRGADMAAMPGDQNAHPAMISPGRIHAEEPEGSLPQASAAAIRACSGSQACCP